MPGARHGQSGVEQVRGACGLPLGESGAKPVPPQAHTPPHLATKIRTFKSTPEDERKQVTVMFADLKGSMELLADRLPEEAGKLLDPCWSGSWTQCTGTRAR